MLKGASKLPSAILITAAALAAAFIFPGAAAAEEPAAFQIGLITPLSGSRASIGEDARAAAELALADVIRDQIAAPGQIEIIFEDSQGDPGKGVGAAQALIARGVRFLITQNSNVSLPISFLANQNKIVQLAITTTSDRFSKADDYTFRTNGSTALEADAMVAFLERKGAIKDGALGMLCMQDEYPATLCAHLDEAFKKRSVSPAVREEFLPAETDFRALIAKLKQKKVQNLLCVGYQTQCGYLVKQQAEQSLNARLILTNVPVNNREFFDTAGAAAEGVFNAYLRINQTHPAAAEFSAKYGRAVNLFSANAYDAVRLAALAAKACGFAADSACLVKALFKVGLNFDGLSGMKSFDPVYGDMPDQYAILVARGGKFTSM